MQNRSLIIILATLSALPLMAGAQDVPTKQNLPEVSLITKPTTSDSMPILPTEGEALTQVKSSPAPQRPLKHLKNNTKSHPTAFVQREAIEDKDDKDSKIAAGQIMDPPVTVLPEATTTVRLSSSDLNRIICPEGDIKEALTSDEKGLMIKITGKDAFLKFKVAKRSDGKLSYSTTPTEIYMVCGGSTYSMIAFPSRMPSQTIKLSSGTGNKIKENEALYAGLPFEKRIMRAIKEVYTDNIPESYTVTQLNKVDLTWKGLVIAQRRDVEIEGEGMRVKEYHISLKAGQQEPFKLSEKMFLQKDFSLNPIAISIDKHTLRPGETSRVFVVEQRPDKPLGGRGLQLPTLDGGDIAPMAEGKPKPSQVLMPPMGGKSARPNFNMPSAAAEEMQ